MNRRDAIKNASLLMGYALSASAIGGVMSGCRSEPKAPDWAPVYFTKEQMPLIESITETLLPKTDTYGAKDVGVPQFIDTMLHNCYKAAEKEHFQNEIAAFQADCLESYQKSFIELEVEQRLEQLKKWKELAQQEWQRPDRKDEDPRPLFSTMKELTLLGFLTSEPVGKELLAYDPVPGQYDGCVPYEEGDRRWAL